MHLAQQALEKRLKSVVLQVDEILGVPNGDYGANALLEKVLGHSIYPGMCGYYSARLAFLRPAVPSPVRGASRPDAGEAAPPGSREANLGRMCGLWGEYSRTRRWQSIAWKRSVGLELEDDERGILESKHAVYGGLLASLIGGDAASLGHFSPGRPFRPISPRDCLDAGALGRRRIAHAGGAPASGLSTAMERGFLACQSAAKTLGGDSPASRDPHIGVARRAMLEFGLMLLLCHSAYYMDLFPHSSRGRYPGTLDGGKTTDLYGRQAGHVLHHLFVGVPHSISQLSSYSMRMGRLWGEVAGS